VGGVGGKLVLRKSPTMPATRSRLWPRQTKSSAKKVVFAPAITRLSSIPASAVYNDSGVLQMTPARPNPALTEDARRKAGNNVFRTVAATTLRARWPAVIWPALQG